MAISCNKLWKMLIDNKMNRKDLKAKAGIGTASIAKLGKGGNITADALLKICASMECGVADIMETYKDGRE